jgi:hypothetical protein
MSKPRARNRLEIKEQGRILAGPLGKVRIGRGPGSQQEKRGCATAWPGRKRIARQKEIALEARRVHRRTYGKWGGRVAIERNGRNNMRLKTENKVLAVNRRCPEKDIRPSGHVGTENAATDAS